MPQLPIDIYHEPYHFGLNLPKRFSPSAARFAKVESNILRTKRAKIDQDKIRQAAQENDKILDSKIERARAKRDNPFKIAPETARTRARAWMHSQGLDPDEDPERLAEIQRELMKNPRRGFTKEDLTGGKSPVGTESAGEPADQAEVPTAAPKASSKGASWWSNLFSPGYSVRETLGISQQGGGKPPVADELVGPVEETEDGIPFRKTKQGGKVTVNDDPEAPAADATLEEKIAYRRRTGKHPAGIRLPDPKAIEEEERRTGKPYKPLGASILDRLDQQAKKKTDMVKDAAGPGGLPVARRGETTESYTKRVNQYMDSMSSSERQRIADQKRNMILRSPTRSKGYRLADSDTLVSGLVPKPTEEDRMKRIRGMATAAGTSDPGGLARLADQQYAIEQVQAAREAEQYAVVGKSPNAYYENLKNFNPFRPGSTMKNPGKETAVERLVEKTIDAIWEEGMSLQDLQEAVRPDVEKVIGVWTQIQKDGEVAKYMSEAEDRGEDVAAFAKAILKDPQAVWAEARYLADREYRIRNRIDARAQAQKAARKARPGDMPESLGGDDEGESTSLFFPGGKTDSLAEGIGALVLDTPIINRISGGTSPESTATRPSVDPEIIRARSQQVLKGLKQEAGTEIRDWSKASVAQAYGAVVDAALAGGAGENFYVPQGSLQSSEIIDQVHGAIQRQGSSWDEDPELLSWTLKYLQDDPVKGKMVVSLINMLHGVLAQSVPDEDARARMRRMFGGPEKKGDE